MKLIDKISPQIKSRICKLIRDYKCTNDGVFLNNFVKDIITELGEKNNFLDILCISKEMVSANIYPRKTFWYSTCANAFVSLSEFGYARLTSFEGIIDFLEHEEKVPFNKQHFSKDSIVEILKHRFSVDDMGSLQALAFPLAYTEIIHASYYEKSKKMRKEKERLISCGSNWASMKADENFRMQNFKEFNMLANIGLMSFAKKDTAYVMSDRRIGLLGILEGYLYGNAENYT